MSIIRGPENAITKNLSELEKNLGIDLKINKDGDLELSNLSDLRLSVGGENAAQAIRIKLGIEPGSLLYHPELGTDLQIGEKIKDAFVIRTQILASLSSDPRFDNVSAKVTILNSTIIVDLRVTLAGTGLEIPLQFAVPQ